MSRLQSRIPTALALGVHQIKGLADRIAAARKRELGNMAVIRNALKKIHDLVNSLDEECGVDPIEVRDIASAALCSAPRNCDRFTDWEKAIDTYHKEMGAGNNTADWGIDKHIRYWIAFVEWLFYPTKEGENRDGLHQQLSSLSRCSKAKGDAK